MDQRDRDAIDDLFDRLDTAERRNPDRDRDAEALIRDRVSRHPAAIYYLAQTAIMQDFALRQAEERVAELERALDDRDRGAGSTAGRGSFLGGLFGRDEPPAAAPRTGPWGSAPAAPTAAPAMGGFGGGGFGGGGFGGGRFGGGGFLAGAAQTAMGVTGGVLLGNMLTDMFEGHEARAAEPARAFDQPQDGDPGSGFDRLQDSERQSFLGGGDGGGGDGFLDDGGLDEGEEW